MLHDIGFLWAVTAVVWLVTLGYVLSLVRRQSRLQREITQLEEAIEAFARDSQASTGLSEPRSSL